MTHLHMPSTPISPPYPHSSLLPLPAVLKTADGDFVEPNGDLNSTACAEMAALAPAPGAADQDWTALYKR